MKNRRNLALLLLIPATLGFGSFEVVCKTMQMDPFQLTFMRFIIGGVVLLPFSMHEVKKRGVLLTRRDWLMLLFLGIVNVCISMNIMQVALMYMPAYLAAMIFSMNPLFVAIFSALILNDRFTWIKAFALLIGAVGAVIAILSLGNTEGDVLAIGIVLQILSAIAFALYTVLGKKISLKIGSMALTSYTAILGGVVSIPILFAFGQTPFVFDWAVNWWQILFLGVGITGLSYMLYFTVLEKIDTSLGSMSFFVKPVVSIVLSIIFLGETVSWLYIPGLVLVLVSIFLLGQSVSKGNKV